MVADKAFLSTSLDYNAVIHRYSHQSTSMEHTPEARSASNKNPLADDEEEILYAIKNNEHIKSIGISGFKFGTRRERDNLSSGEVLVSPTTKFRVVGIQNSETAINRRVVFLNPIPSTEIRPNEIQKNLFNGEPLI